MCPVNPPQRFLQISVLYQYWWYVANLSHIFILNAIDRRNGFEVCLGPFFKHGHRFQRHIRRQSTF